METIQQVKLTIVPMFLKQANEMVAKLHRHHKPVKWHVFSLGVTDGENIRGVAIIFRPACRHLEDGYTLEVARVATDGCPNACSALYGAAWRVSKEMGYRKLITYTMPEETGSSLRGAGWVQDDGLFGGGTWSNNVRTRTDKAPITKKLRWHKE